MPVNTATSIEQLQFKLKDQGQLVVGQAKVLYFWCWIVLDNQQKKYLDMKSRKLLNNCYCSQHPNQKLNMVCTSTSCPGKGLICSLCRNDPSSQTNIHQSHDSKIVPFKYLINSLESSFDLNKDFDMHNQEYAYVKKMEGLKDQSLFVLRDMINNVAEIIERLEQQIIDNFETARSALIYRGETIRKLKKVIQRATIHDMRKEEKFQLITQMKALVGFIRQNEIGEFGNRYELNISPHHIVGKFVSEQQNLKVHCRVVEQQLGSMNFDQVYQQREREEGKPSKKEKKNRKKFENLAQKSEIILDELNDLSFLNSSISKVSSEFKKQDQDPKLSKLKNARKQKEEKKMKKIEKEEGMLNKISKPLASLITDFIPSKQKKFDDILSEQKMENQELAVKKQKSQKSYNLMSSLMLDDKDIESDEINLPGFSFQYKNPSIKLTKQNKAARQTLQEGFVLISQNLIQRSSIAFKIKLKQYIFIGLGLKTHLEQKKFGPLNNKIINHGVFGLDFTGLSLCHHDNQQNKSHKQFSFEDHDIINIKYMLNQLWFEKYTGKKNHKKATSICIQLKLDEQALKDVYFCVYLGGKGDSVQIL